LYHDPESNPAGFKPHFGQRLILEDSFITLKERILAVNARNWGKTEVGIHIPSRVTLTRERIHPNYPPDQLISSYYVAPTKTHAKQIIYDTGRIEKCVPQQYIWDVKRGLNEVWFTIDQKEPCGVLYIIGTGDVFAHVGVKHAGPIIVDETAWTKEEWHKAKEQDYKAWLPLVIYFTTWPKERDHFIDNMVHEYKANPRRSFHQRPQFDNITLEENNPGHFKKQLEDYERAGDMIGYQRDVLSMRVIGDDQLVFSKFDYTTYYKAKIAGDWDKNAMVPINPKAYQEVMEEVDFDEHVWPHKYLMQYCKKMLHECTKIVHFDPGHTGAFAVNLDMANDYTKEYFRLGEVYEKNCGDLDVRELMRKVVPIIFNLWPDVDPKMLEFGYDEAATWFKAEFNAFCREVWSKNPKNWPKEDQYFFHKIRKNFPRPWSLAPTRKSKSKEEDRIMSIRTMLGQNKLRFSDRCPYSIWEMGNYRLDDNGKLPDKDNHTIDNLRYGLDLIGYELEIKEKEFSRFPDRVAIHLASNAPPVEKTPFDDWFNY
jgi:hypothetical protein